MPFAFSNSYALSFFYYIHVGKKSMGHFKLSCRFLTFCIVHTRLFQVQGHLQYLL